MNGRIEQWADKLLKVRERKLVILFCSLCAGIILILTVLEKLQPFIHLRNKASADASEIARIRREVEGQRDTIALVLRDASQAHNDMQRAAALSREAKAKSQEAAEKAAEITKLAKEASKQLAQIRTTSDFSFLLARAASDDRKSFDKLVAIADNDGAAFHDVALAAVLRIVGDLGSTFSLGIDWKKVGFDPKTATFSEFVEFFRDAPTFDKPGILSGLWDQERFSKYDKLSFTDGIIRSTESIRVLHAACMAMNREAKVDKNIIAYQVYLDWWRNHAAEFLEIPPSSGLSGEQSPSLAPSAFSTPTISPSP